jgi:hypothetical protein
MRSFHESVRGGPCEKPIIARQIFLSTVSMLILTKPRIIVSVKLFELSEITVRLTCAAVTVYRRLCEGAQDEFINLPGYIKCLSADLEQKVDTLARMPHTIDPGDLVFEPGALFSHWHAHH